MIGGEEHLYGSARSHFQLGRETGLTIHLGTRIDYALRIMGELGQVDSILFTIEDLVMLALLCIVNLQCVIIACRHKILASVVKI